MTVRRTASAALTLTLVLAGCSGGNDDGASPAAPTTAAPSPSASASPTVKPSRVPPVTAPVDPASSGAGVTVVLEPDGLGFRHEGASISEVPFGASVSTVTTALASSLGTGTTRSLPECGQGPRTQVEYNGFTVLLDKNRFVGWTESGSPTRDLSTADDIRLQVTLAEVKQAYPKTQVSTGSVGPEFFNENGISGFLDGTTSQSRVTQLYGGETCFLR